MVAELLQVFFNSIFFDFLYFFLKCIILLCFRVFEIFSTSFSMFLFAIFLVFSVLTLKNQFFADDHKTSQNIMLW